MASLREIRLYLRHTISMYIRLLNESMLPCERPMSKAYEEVEVKVVESEEAKAIEGKNNFQIISCKQQF